MLKSDLEKLLSKYLFVEGIVKKTIIVSNKKKADVESQLDKIQRIIKVNGSYDYLLALPIHQLTSEKLEELKKQIQDKKELFKKTKETSVETIWTDDLHEFKKAL